MVIKLTKYRPLARDFDNDSFIVNGADLEYTKKVQFNISCWMMLFCSILYLKKTPEIEVKILINHAIESVS